MKRKLSIWAKGFHVCVIVVAVVVLSPRAQANTTTGMGGNLCSRYSLERNSKDISPILIKAIYTQWVRGWIVGHNECTPDLRVSTNTNDDAIVERLDRFCRTNPTKTVRQAATATLLPRIFQPQEKP